MPDPRGHTLFTEALGAVAAVIDAHRDASPWREIAERTSGAAEPRVFGVAVHEADPANPVDQYAVRIHDGRFEVLERGHAEPAIHWRVSVDELRRIRAGVDALIAEPEALDLGWLERLLGIERTPQAQTPWRIGRARRPRGHAVE